MKTTLQNVSPLLVFGLVTLAHGGQDGFTSFDFPGPSTRKQPQLVRLETSWEDTSARTDSSTVSC